MTEVVHLPGPHPNVIRVFIIILALAPLTLALPSPFGDDEPVTTQPMTRPTLGDDGLPEPVVGFAINCHHISDLDLYLRSVDGIADLGANTLIVVTPMYQRKVDSNSIRRLRTRCATNDQLVALLERGAARGLFTILMPIVLIEKPGEKDWRGKIRPKDWPEWWESYDTLLDRFLGITQRAPVDMLVVGSELNTTEDQLDRWQHVVTRVRDEFDGLIAYSSNWDRYQKVELWPLVDVMCVSSYFELKRDEPGAPEDDLVRAWRGPQEALFAEARKWKKPMVLSEIGYPSLPWANAHPWNYVADGEEADHEAQARCWRAFFRAWAPILRDPDAPIAGFCGYRWDPYRDGDDDDTGYGIVGKPSHAVLRSAFRSLVAGTDS